jgi:hypothetical protein
MADMTVTATPKNKVIAATGGAAVGSAVSVIILWLLTAYGHITFPQEVSDALSTLFTTIVTGAVGYIVPPGASEGSVVDASGKVKSALVK